MLRGKKMPAVAAKGRLLAHAPVLSELVNGRVPANGLHRSALNGLAPLARAVVPAVSG